MGMTVNVALDFVEKQYGDDIKILKTENKGKDVRIEWVEVGDNDRYFSLIGYGRYKRVVEKIGGEC